MAPEFETVYLREDSLPTWFEDKEIKPLNLCLKETGNRRSNNASEEEEKENDVIFVKEYKRRSSSANSQKTKSLRRNPSRKARDNNRFSDYVDGSFEQDENPEESSELNFEVSNFKTYRFLLNHVGLKRILQILILLK